MGLGGISIWQLLIILAIIVMLFGTSRLRNIGPDLGSAIKGFRDSMAKDKAESKAIVPYTILAESAIAAKAAIGPANAAVNFSTDLVKLS